MGNNQPSSSSTSTPSSSSEFRAVGPSDGASRQPPSDQQVDEVFATVLDAYQSKLEEIQNKAREGSQDGNDASKTNWLIDEELLMLRLRAKLQEHTSFAMSASATVCQNVTECIHQTPLVQIKGVDDTPLQAEVVAKVEYLNPGCSVKDRIALSMIEDAELKGLLVPGHTTVIDITSGNTGIGLGVVCAAKGYKCIQVIPEPMSIERRAVMLALGVEVVVTSGASGIAGAIKKYLELVQQYGNNGWSPRQFDNPANLQAHIHHTGPEIWEQCGGRIDAIVAAYGTGGTVSGITTYLRQKNPNFRAICVEPMESSLLSGDAPAPHGIQGIAPPFVPDNTKVELFDEVLRCPTSEAMATSRALASRQGLLCGISAGANVWAALKVAQRPEMRGKRIVTILPSGAERYLTTPLYEPLMQQARELPLSPIDDSIVISGINFNTLETLQKDGKIRDGFRVSS